MSNINSMNTCNICNSTIFDVFVQHKESKIHIECYKKINNHICSICLEKTTNNDTYITDCNHYFHKKCISKWNNKSSKCPNCRERHMKLMSHNELMREIYDRIDTDLLKYDKKYVILSMESLIHNILTIYFDNHDDIIDHSQIDIIFSSIKSSFINKYL